MRLSQLNITDVAIIAGKKSIVLNAVEDRFKHVDGKATEILEGFSVTFSGLDGTEKIKLPLQAKKSVEEARNALKGNIVIVTFENFVATPYAILDKENGRLRSGISCKAENMNILKVIPVETEDEDDEELAL